MLHDEGLRLGITDGEMYVVRLRQDACFCGLGEGSTLSRDGWGVHIIYDSVAAFHVVAVQSRISINDRYRGGRR